MSSNGTALITGGAKRIGREIALFLASKGVNIALHYNNSRKEAESLKQEISNNFNVKCKIFKANLTDQNRVKELFDEVSESFKNINIIINNASVFEPLEFREMSEEYLDENFAIHLKAPLFLSQKFAEFYKGNNGNIINITDSNTRKNAVKYFGYMLSKKCLNDLTTQMARVLAPNIRVNAIAPGTILPSGEMSKKDIEKKKKRLPLKDIATPEDIAQTIWQIIENRAITGHIFYLDGGEHLI